eukprot:356754-Chlamydomonas_euryale.AAC.6
MSAQRDAAVMMAPFSTDSGSVGRPSLAHLALVASSVSRSIGLMPCSTHSRRRMCCEGRSAQQENRRATGKQARNHVRRRATAGRTARATDADKPAHMQPVLHATCPA